MRTNGLKELDSGSWSICVMTKVMWQNPDYSEGAEEEGRIVETKWRKKVWRRKRNQ